MSARTHEKEDKTGHFGPEERSGAGRRPSARLGRSLATSSLPRFAACVITNLSTSPADLKWRDHATRDRSDLGRPPRGHAPGDALRRSARNGPEPAAERPPV